ncbi:MAG: Ig-like domain-containing protein, partial [Sphingomonadaceae bacterium]
NWSITSSTLATGSHSLTAKQTDAAGNVSVASGALTLVIDTTTPAAPSAPLLASASDSGTSGDNLTSVTTPVLTGTGEANATVKLYDTDGTTLLGTATVDGSGNWSITSSTLNGGSHTLTVKQTDAAGNVSPASTALALTIDASVPSAPSAPALAAASDTGTQGDLITTLATPLLTGSGEANATVRLYDSDGTTLRGTATADGSGNWSITSAALSIGAHTLTVKQTDAAGNVSVASAALVLTIDAVPPPPPTVIDGVTVVEQPVTLPGGGGGTQITIPIVTSERGESSGTAGVADIPLVSGGGSNLLLAQVAPGFGLSASGGPSQSAGSSTEHLIQAILAATPNNPADDRSHLTGNGVTFLNQLASSTPLLVQTIIPSSGASAPTAPLTLTGTSSSSQHTALVIDTTQLAPGSQLVLQSVDFAALVGVANVTANTNGQILTGDQASQSFTVGSGLSSNLFSGGGDDTLLFKSPARISALAPGELRQGAAAPTTHSVLHGGLDNDTVSLNGVLADYSLDWHQGYVVVSAKAQPQQQALVINVETLVFSDQSVTVQNGAQLTLIAGLYNDVLQRQGDYKGVEFWANALQNGRTLGGVALDLIRSTEAQALHVRQFSGDNGHDIDLLYQAIYSRHSDAGGLAFWDAAMQRGATLEQVADAMLHAPEIVGHQVGALGWDFLLA